MTIRETRVLFPSGDLRLEGMLASPEGATQAMVVCHPHPEYGGTMDNPVVAVLAERAAHAGLATLRFNFRGVGGSDGAYSGTFAESEDAHAAALFLRERTALERLTLVGYSFGAMVASLAAARESLIERLVAVALPATMFDTRFLETCDKPKLFLLGEEDDYCPPAALQALVARLPGRNELRILAGADHFLFGYEEEIAAEILAFLEEPATEA
ncbi:MAG: alpha/beta hydrolase [Candidatus Binatia bacterium]